jgi:hypothetical protein
MFGNLTVALPMQHHAVVYIENVFHWSAFECSAGLNLVHLWGELTDAEVFPAAPAAPVAECNLSSHRGDMRVSGASGTSFF